MNYFKYIVLTMFIGLVGAIQAQDEVGYIKYNITDIQSDNQMVMQQASMFKNGYMEQYFGADKNLSISNMAGMTVTKTLYDKKTGNSVMYMDIMGRKYKIPMTKEEADSMQSDQDMDVKVEKVTDATKEILGYNTHKVLLKISSEGTTSTIELWVTDQLKGDMTGYNQMLKLTDTDLELEGLPLQMTIDVNGMMQFTYTATEVKDKSEVDPEAMKIDDTGYQEMTMEEFQDAMGGMGRM